MEHSWSYIIGFGLGVLIIAGLFWLAFRLIGRKGRVHWKQEYDERQQLAQGKAAKLAMYVALVWLALDGIVSSMFYNWADIFTHLFAAVIVIAMVYAVACIRRDAYIGLKDSARRWMWVMIGLGLLNLGIGLTNLSHGQTLLAEGRLGSNSISFMCSLLVLIVAAALGLYGRRAQKRAADGDEPDRDESEV